MCTRSAFKIYICIHSALLFLFGVHCSLCLQVRMQYYTCFRDYGFIFSSFMLFLLSDTHHESHNYKLRSMNREFLSIITCSASLFLLLPLSLSQTHTHTHTLLLTLAFECTVAECAHANNIHSFRERVFFFVSFTESFLSVWFFLLWACNQVPCAAV